VFAARRLDGPADHHAGLARRERAFDARGQLTQQRQRAAEGRGKKARAVERGPDELGAHIPLRVGQRRIGRPRRGDERRAVDRTGEDAQAIARGALRPADEATRQQVMNQPGATLRGQLGRGERGRRRRLHGDLEGPRLGHRPLAMQQEQLAGGGLLAQLEQGRERRWRQQSHRDRPASRRRDQAADIAAIARVGRAAEARLDDQRRAHRGGSGRA
jgi:hypothetical protein